MIDQATNLRVQNDQPLIGLLLDEDGQAATRFFVDEADADAASESAMQAALAAIGAWSDIDWAEIESELYRIRHEGQPTPPITEL